MGTHSSSNTGNAAAIHQVSWFGVDENLEERPIYRSWFAEGHTPVFDINCFFPIKLSIGYNELVSKLNKLLVDLINPSVFDSILDIEHYIWLQPVVRSLSSACVSVTIITYNFNLLLFQLTNNGWWSVGCRQRILLQTWWI